ncbi:hypothetical protein RHGRI_032044 [Rhododendron griersonianum]|uniref:Uncharacterized protein n=1 Tax=Rhododendron griersonianum TaxID=479676 RepID=A0AAV6IAQ6_9ERIC|nr:hypothetical protein RHGRI_032044 [Rhododendron griersonianum]
MLSPKTVIATVYVSSQLEWGKEISQQVFLSIKGQQAPSYAPLSAIESRVLLPKVRGAKN